MTGLFMWNQSSAHIFFSRRYYVKSVSPDSILYPPTLQQILEELCSFHDAITAIRIEILLRLSVNEFVRNIIDFIEH
ncbi:hypothetical protein J6590_040163 [Homalodisca vitripennis]|nr:hypothetical protein J6590_040163 [Homalodisca vitripennis]